MMLLRLLPAVVAALALPPPAAAGGWWSYVHLDRTTVAVGQRVEASAEVLFESQAALQEARENGRFHVYLLRGLDRSLVASAMRVPEPRNWWSPGDAELVEAGRVRLGGFDANIARARASFRVPDLPPAGYAVMLCDAGCTRSLAEDVVPTRLTVVADPATARLAERADRLERLLEREGARLAGRRAAARRTRANAAEVRRDAEELQARVGLLERELLEREGSSGRSPWLLVGASLLGAIVGVLAPAGLRRGLVASGAGRHRSGTGTAIDLDRLGPRVDSARGREGAVCAAPRRARDTDRGGARVGPVRPRPGARSLRGRGGRLPRR